MFLDKEISNLVEVLLTTIFIFIGLIVSISSDLLILIRIRILVIINLLQTVTIICYCFKNNNFKKRFTLFAFNIAYFILLQSSYLVNIANDNYFGIYVFNRVTSISLDNELRGIFYILLVQFIIFLSYNSTKDKLYKNIHIDRVQFINVTHWSYVIMVVGGAAAFLKLILKIIYVIQYGYLSTYLADGSALYQNPLLDAFDGFYFVGLLGYLITLPNYKSTKKVILVFALYTILLLFTGQRGETVVNVILIFWYLSKRDVFLQEDTPPILSIKKILIIGVLGVCIVAFLYDFGYARVGVSTENLSFLEKILNFMDTQGRSGKLVALGFEYENEIGEYVHLERLFWSPIYTFMQNNAVMRMFFGSNLGQSVYNLTDFGSIITYITNPESYLGGAGLGTCFISEISLSYGIIGTILFSILMGLIIKKIDNIDFNNWGTGVLLMSSFRFIVYIPRNSALGIIPGSVITIIFIVMIYAITNMPIIKNKGSVYVE